MATLKRKHVVFDEPVQGAEGGDASPAPGPSIHPDRLAAVAASQPVKKPKLPKVGRRGLLTAGQIREEEKVPREEGEEAA